MQAAMVSINAVANVGSYNKFCSLSKQNSKIDETLMCPKGNFWSHRQYYHDYTSKKIAFHANIEIVYYTA
jgi:hypothetical protein